MKGCQKCGVRKPLDAFHKLTKAPDGRQARCKSCACKTAREHYYANKGEKDQYAARRRVEDLDSARALAREYYENSSEESKERVRAQAKERYLRVRHTPKGRAQACRNFARYRARKVAATPPGPEDPRIKALYEIAACMRAEGRDVHVDHIQPLSKGGMHVFENLQILPAVQNLRKHAKFEF